MQTSEQDIPSIERIQPDLERLSEGSASGIQITVVAIACMLIVSLMIYSLNRPASELIAAAPPAAQTTGTAPSAAQPVAQTGGTIAGSENAFPKGYSAAQDRPAQQSVPLQTKPGAVDDDSKR